MTGTIRYRPAEPADAVWLAPRLRPADAAEVVAATGMAPSRVVPRSLAASSVAVCAEVDGAPAGLFGVAPLNVLLGEGGIWMLATPEADRHARAWLREAPGWLVLLGDGWRVLRNHVHAENHRSRRWLARMGFTLGPAAPHGAHGQLFRPFWKELSDV